MLVPVGLVVILSLIALSVSYFSRVTASDAQGAYWADTSKLSVTPTGYVTNALGQFLAILAITNAGPYTFAYGGHIETFDGKRWVDMTDDVVFLIPGRPPMTKTEFASLSAAQPKTAAPQIDGLSEIQEIKVLGDWAFMWSKLRVEVRPPGIIEPMVRAGHTLSILKKQNGQWLLARDANMLVPVK